MPYCGIDLKPYIKGLTSWEHWARCMMGLKPSPYLATKFFHIAFDMVLGDRRDLDNVFHWTPIKLNLSGGVDYDELQSAEVFVFTDNTTAESAYDKGNSTSKHLFNLVL